MKLPKQKLKYIHTTDNIGRRRGFARRHPTPPFAQEFYKEEKALVEIERGRGADGKKMGVTKF